LLVGRVVEGLSSLVLGLVGLVLQVGLSLVDLALGLGGLVARCVTESFLCLALDVVERHVLPPRSRNFPLPFPRYRKTAGGAGIIFSTRRNPCRTCGRSGRPAPCGAAAAGRSTSGHRTPRT